MDAVARFVYGSGGSVTIPELDGFFADFPSEGQAFYAAAAPVRQLKKIIRHSGSLHGLSWGDEGPGITHELTQAQQETFPQTVELWVPRCLDALETLLHGVPDARLKAGEFARLIIALPLEMAFMRRRSGGNVIRFVRKYDPEEKRFRTSETELWLVRASTSLAYSSESPPRLQHAASVCESSRVVPKAVLNASSCVLRWDEYPSTSPQPPTPLPLSVDSALHALLVVSRVLAAQRIFRLPCSLSSLDVLFEFCRVVLQRLHEAPPSMRAAPKTQRALGARAWSEMASPTTGSSSPSRNVREPEPKPVRVLRLLVPTASATLEWRVTA